MIDGGSTGRDGGVANADGSTLDGGNNGTRDSGNNGGGDGGNNDTGDGGNNGGGDGGNDGGGDGGNIGRADGSAPLPDAGVLAMSPNFTSVPLGSTQRFEVGAAAGAIVQWTVERVPNGNPTVGTLTPVAADPRLGDYAAPRSTSRLPLTYRIRAVSPGGIGTAIVTLVAPTPTITSVSPSQVDEGAQGVMITVTGTGFTTSTLVELDGIALPATFVSWTTMTADLSASLLTVAGERRLIIRNPAPGGGTAVVTFPVVLRRTIIEPGAPPGAPGLFDNAATGTNPARQPDVTYPEDGSVAPLDFPTPVVSWDQPAPSNVCRLRISGPAVVVDVYTSTQGGLPPERNPSVELTDTLWSTIVGTAFTELRLSYQVACAEVALSGGSLVIVDGMIYQSAPVRYTVLRESAGGRIVYFSGNIEGLWRIDIGGNTAVAQPWMGPDPAFALQTNDCVGCHSFSGDGRRMSYSEAVLTWQLGVAEIDTQVPSVYVPPTQSDVAVWTAMHPSGDWVLNTNLQAEIEVMDADTGLRVATAPTASAGLLATQANWSPRGDRFAFVSGTATNENGVTDFFDGQVWTMEFSTTATGAPAFGASTMLAGPDVAGGTAYYPAFSPDGEWVVFCRAPTGSSYANSDAKLWLARADGSTAPVPLTNANRTGALQNSWPRWAPTASAGKYWLLFSSTRAYPPLNGTGPQQLWVTRVDVSSQGGPDPSTPAIWLSGQEPFTGNLTAEWTIAR